MHPSMNPNIDPDMMDATTEEEIILVNADAVSPGEYRTLHTYQQPDGWLARWEDDDAHRGYASREAARAAAYGEAAERWPGYRLVRNA